MVGPPLRPTIASLRVLDRLRFSPPAPFHYLTYHKAFHFDVRRSSSSGGSPRDSNDEILR